MAGNEIEIGLLLPLNSRNRRKLLMERQTQKKPGNVWMKDIFTRRKTQGDYYNLVQDLKLVYREFYFFKFCGYFVVKTKIIVKRFRQLFVYLPQLTDSHRT